MGRRLNMDDECVVCGEYTDLFCDNCGTYVCEEHAIRKPLKNGVGETVFCPDCAKKNKKAVFNRQGEMCKYEGC